MIDLSKIEDATETLDVKPSDNIFEELGRNTYDYKDLLSELIDNTIAARNDELVSVKIDIFLAPNWKPVEFVISDNAKGISEEDFGTAVSPAARQSKNSLNEHGMGMKQAVAAIGKLNYLATKTKTEEKARLIKEFKFGSIKTYRVDFNYISGTEISITNINSIVTSHKATYTRTIIPYLGARYRRFLKPDDKKLHLSITLREADNRSKVLESWDVNEVKPVYFHPSTRTNKPVISKFPINGDNWKAELTFGYAPNSKDDHEELGVEEYGKFHPYKVALSTQGFDIFFHDRIILFHQLSEIGIVSGRHNDYNNIRGEINLKSGFATAITKNTIIQDENFLQCISKIKEILNGKEPGPGGRVKDYLTQKTYPDEIPEKLLRDRLIKHLKANPLNPKSNVKKEYVIEGIEGFIDILADGEAWEIKTNQASAYDVYQLFMYMDVGDIKKGFLVAQSFTTGAEVARDFIKENHNKEIILAQRSAFPINNPPDDQEREVYY